MAVSGMLALAVVGTAVSIDARNDAARAGRQAQSEKRAQNASDAARERRQQIREERVRRAKIIQSAENTGVSGSSGEAGALGSLSTTLSSNIGTNAGKLQSANNISLFQQQQADAMNMADNAQAVAGFAGSMFTAGGGFARMSIFK